MSKYFKRPDKHCLPIYIASDGIYRIQDCKVKGHINREYGENDYTYDLVFRPKFREERICSQKEFETLRKKLNLRCIDCSDNIHVYEDKTKEYYYDRRSGKLVIMYFETVIAFGFIHYKDCLDYSEKYIERRYDLKRSENKGDKNEYSR